MNGEKIKEFLLVDGSVNYKEERQASTLTQGVAIVSFGLLGYAATNKTKKRNQRMRIPHIEVYEDGLECYNYNRKRLEVKFDDITTVIRKKRRLALYNKYNEGVTFFINLRLFNDKDPLYVEAIQNLQELGEMIETKIGGNENV